MLNIKNLFHIVFLNVLKENNFLPKEILVIDDRLLTGVLAAIISKTQACLITKPYIDYKYRPVQEIVFCLIRKLERKIFSI